MTLDTLTRANAERKHAELRNSFAQTRSQFRERFRHDGELFRSLTPAPDSGDGDGDDFGGLSVDLVRNERISQCCKRVRVWRRQATNPLLQYKQQYLAKPVAKTTDHRMHLSVIMTMIIDIFEQKVSAEAGMLPTLHAVGGIVESFPEYVVKYLAARSSSRRAAVDQVSNTVALLLQPSTHARVRTFASLCGLDDRPNPPEKIRAFLHMLESLHRLKVAHNNSNARIEDMPLGETVFYNIGVSLTVVHKVIAELFEEEYYWNFCFWHGQCRELKVNCEWPRQAKAELEEKAVNLASVTRSSTLKKIDGDAFLELLLDTWTQRAKTLIDQLDAATNEEERKAQASLQQKQLIQEARGHIPPPTPEEQSLFDELVGEYWNAEVPWLNGRIQRRLASIGNSRTLAELTVLYKRHLAELDDSKRVWDWTRWPWDVDWEWGFIAIRSSTPTASFIPSPETTAVSAEANGPDELQHHTT